MTLKCPGLLNGFFLLIFALSSSVNAQDLPKYWEQVVVRIGVQRQDDSGKTIIRSHGTGFLVIDDSLWGNRGFLVTNRHVLMGKDAIFVRFNKTDYDPQTDSHRYHHELCRLIDGDSILWKGHPDSTVDIAAVQLPPIRANVDARMFNYARFKSFDSLRVGEDVFFYGFPSRVRGREGRGDFPIIRSGIVAFKAYESTSIEGQRIDSATFLIDGFSWGGNSGSPVLTRGKRGVKSGLVGIVEGHLNNRTRFIRSDYYLSVQDDSVSVSFRPDTFYVAANSGLAKAICADQIKETLDQFNTQE